jgi:hypothetical protein
MAYFEQRLNLTLEQYVTQYLPTERLDNLMVRTLAGVSDVQELYPREVSDYIATNPSLMLTLAKRNLLSLTFFGVTVRQTIPFRTLFLPLTSSSRFRNTSTSRWRCYCTPLTCPLGIFRMYPSMCCTRVGSQLAISWRDESRRRIAWICCSMNGRYRFSKPG